MIEPHLPPAHGTGRPRSWPMREIVNGIFYALPLAIAAKRFATVGHDLSGSTKFRDVGLLEKINHSLVWPIATAGRTQASARRSDFIDRPERQRRPRLVAPGLRGQEDQGAQAPRWSMHRRARPRARVRRYPGPRVSGPLLRLIGLGSRRSSDRGYAGERHVTVMRVEIVRKSHRSRPSVQHGRWVREGFFAWQPQRALR